MKKTVEILVCQKCNYQWQPRVNKPVQCPKCKSYNWDTPPAAEKAEVQNE